jgi:ABC-type multidrug transport system permease subunit
MESLNVVRNVMNLTETVVHALTANYFAEMVLLIVVKTVTMVIDSMVMLALLLVAVITCGAAFVTICH